MDKCCKTEGATYFIDQDSHVLIFSFQLLGDMLLDRSNAAVMMRYVSSKDNLMILMNLLRVSVSHFTSGNLSLQSTCHQRLKCSSLQVTPCTICHPFSTFLVFYFVRIRVKIFKLRHFMCSRYVQQP
jgi:hypothetical protein